MGLEKVTADSAGRVCPYCHTELEKGEQAHRCERCGALHHVDCWQEGGGCSVFGCDSAETPPGEDPGAGRDPSAGEASESDPDGTPPGRSPAATPTGDDFTIERRESAGYPWWRERKNQLLAAVVAAAIAIVGAVAIFVLGGSNDQPQKPTPGKPAAKKLDKKKKKAQEEKKRQKETKILLQLGLVWTTDPDGNWEGFLPAGDRWGDPQSLGDQNGDSSNPRYRTVKYGPDGGPDDGFVVIDTTPAEDPTGNEENYVVKGKRLSSKRIRHGDFLFADMITFDGGTDDCDYGPCAKAMLADGNGGGVTVLARALSMDQAITIVKRFAATVRRHY